MGTWGSSDAENAGDTDLAREDAPIDTAHSDCPQPRVTGISRSNASTAGVTTLRVFGRNFGEDAVVEFGESVAEVLGFEKNKSVCKIDVIAPASEAGEVILTVTYEGKKSAPWKVGDRFGLFKYVPPPIIDEVNQGWGTAEGGTEVTITGGYFLNGARVYFGDEGVPAQFDSETQLRAIVPPAEVGEVTIVVVNPHPKDNENSAERHDYNSAEWEGGRFTYVPPPPIVNGVEPPRCSVNGGAELIITGTHFQDGATVLFGEEEVVAEFDRDTQLRVTAPAGAEDVTIKVKNPEPAELDNIGEWQDRVFTYVPPPPTVANVVPALGRIDGQTEVTITGAHFQNGARVRIGDEEVAAEFDSDTQLRATAPAVEAEDRVTVNITVRNPNPAEGENSGTWDEEFTYVPPPRIDNVAPATGSSLGGLPVTITGELFQDGATVRFGEGAEIVADFTNPATLTVTTPDMGAGTVTITVKNPEPAAGANSVQWADGRFTFVPPPPTITHLDPPSGSPDGVTEVAVHGEHFQDGAMVTFGDQDVVPQDGMTDTILRVIAPTMDAAGAAQVIVTVTNPAPEGGPNDAQCAEQFSYAPRVTAINPDHGEMAGNTHVTITGGDFGYNPRVFIGDRQAADVRIVDGTGTIISVNTPAREPPSAENVSVDVRVTADGNRATLTNAFTYEAVPSGEGVVKTTVTENATYTAQKARVDYTSREGEIDTIVAALGNYRNVSVEGGKVSVNAPGVFSWSGEGGNGLYNCYLDVPELGAGSIMRLWVKARIQRLEVESEEHIWINFTVFAIGEHMQRGVVRNPVVGVHPNFANYVDPSGWGSWDGSP